MATTEQEVKDVGLFPPQPKPQPCSWIECLAGHRWPPTMTVAQCPGDGGPTVMVKQENCPFCNEPACKLSFRLDVVPAGSGVVPRCKGVQPPGETLDLELTAHGWETGQGGFVDFEARKIKEGQK